MPPLLRRLLAVIAGTVTSVLVVSLSDAIVGALHPLPAVTGSDQEGALARGIAAMPPLAHLLLLAGWALAGLAGAWMAVRLTSERWVPAGWIVLGILLASTVANLFMIPHPAWMLPVAIVAVPLAGWAGIRLAAAARTGGRHAAAAV